MGKSSIFRLLLVLVVIVKQLNANSYHDVFDKTLNDELVWDEFRTSAFVGPGVGKAQGTNFCNVVFNKSQPLTEALKGMELSIAVQYGPGFDFFLFDPDEALSPSNPSGMIADILDELASRAKFTWRESFAAYDIDAVDTLVGKGAEKWDRMLKETTTFFDVAVDKWFLTTKRLENETVFLHSWFDATLILVDQGDVADLNWLGFAAPFEYHVWIGIAVTIVLSALIMILIESLEDRREGRSMRSWFSDHLYLTSLAFSQQFMYANPRSGAGRVFLSSFAFWATLIGATYTANLASLLVENALASPVTSIEGAMAAKLSICIHEGSASQTIMQSLYPALKDYPKLEEIPTVEGMYKHLNSGKCDILVGTRQEYEIFRIQEEFGCQLVQAGSELHSGSASFAIEFDPVNCDSVLAYVFNIHFNEMSVDGNMTKFWKKYLSNRGGTCEGVEAGVSRRLESGEEQGGDTHTVSLDPRLGFQHRQLGGAAKVASVSTDDALAGDATDESLNITGMAGVFLVHGVGTTVAILLALYSHVTKRSIRETARRKKVFGIGNTLGKTDMEIKYDEFKAQMMAQMDQFFEEHQKSEDINRSSHRTMPLSSSARRPDDSMIRSSIVVFPSTPSGTTNFLDLSGRSVGSASRKSKRSISPYRGRGNTTTNSNVSGLDHLRFDPNTLLEEEESTRSNSDVEEEETSLTPPAAYSRRSVVHTPPRSPFSRKSVARGGLPEKWH